MSDPTNYSPLRRERGSAPPLPAGFTTLEYDNFPSGLVRDLSACYSPAAQVAGYVAPGDDGMVYGFQNGPSSPLGSFGPISAPSVYRLQCAAKGARFYAIAIPSGHAATFTSCKAGRLNQWDTWQSTSRVLYLPDSFLLPAPASDDSPLRFFGTPDIPGNVQLAYCELGAAGWTDWQPLPNLPKGMTGQLAVTARRPHQPGGTEPLNPFLVCTEKGSSAHQNKVRYLKWGDSQWNTALDDFDSDGTVAAARSADGRIVVFSRPTAHPSQVSFSWEEDLADPQFPKWYAWVTLGAAGPFDLFNYPPGPIWTGTLRDGRLAVFVQGTLASNGNWASYWMVQPDRNSMGWSELTSYSDAFMLQATVNNADGDLLLIGTDYKARDALWVIKVK